MPDAYTSNKLGLIEPASGSYSGTWDLPLYANWQTIDASLGGTTSITLSSSNVTLTVPTYPTSPNPPSVSTSAQNLRLYLTGTLSADVIVYLPATVGGFWIIDNQTSGAYTVTIKTTAVGSAGVSLSAGDRRIVNSDGTNVTYSDVINIPSFPAGAIIPFGMTTPPSGWLKCNGASYSTAAYANLFAAIGYTWGGVGASFNVPDLRGIFLRGWDDGANIDTTILQGTIVSGSAVVNAISSTTGLSSGQTVTGTGIPSGTTIVAINSPTALTLSQNATASSTTLTGNTTINSAVITNLSSTTGLVVGQQLSGTNIPSGATITSIVSSTSINISQNATATGTGITFTFFTSLTFAGRAYASYQADGVGPISLNDPGHRHASDFSDRTGSGGSPIAGPYVGNSVNPIRSAKTGITVNTISETRVKNYAVQYCIKT